MGNGLSKVLAVGLIAFLRLSPASGTAPRRRFVSMFLRRSGLVRRSKLHSDRPFVELLGLVALGLLLGVSGQAMAQPNYNYTTLDGPGGGLTVTFAVGINGSGQIVGYYLNGSAHGFLLDNGSYTTLDVPGSTLSRAP